ncbi:MAG TPA: four helix bundle protein [Longimicrobiales bacterium]|nr:four helix bundle protein [Longimicrobiales bacterium]
MDALFDHERLEVYQLAREFNRGIQRLIEELPSGHSETKDNLRRAAKSITRNIAEGSGRWKPADKVRFYHIARASATESAASLDELVDFCILGPEQIQPHKAILSRLVGKLISMIRSVEARETARSPSS